MQRCEGPLQFQKELLGNQFQFAKERKAGSSSPGTTALRCGAHGDTELPPNCPVPEVMVGSWLCPPRVRHGEDPCKTPWGEKKKKEKAQLFSCIQTQIN